LGDLLNRCRPVLSIENRRITISGSNIPVCMGLVFGKEKKAMLQRRNIYQKRVLALVAIALFVFGGFAAAEGMQAIATTRTGNLTGDVYLSSDVGQVWGWNGSVWEAATLTVTSGSPTVTASFANGFHVSQIVVFDKNPRYNVQGILNSSYIYATVNAATSVTNATGAAETDNYTIDNVALIVGEQVNSTSMKSSTAKNVIAANDFATENIYSNNVNNLNTSVAMSIFGLGASNYNDYLSEIITLNGSIATTNHLSVKLTQTLQQPFSLNLIEDFEVMITVLAMIVLGLVLMGMPRIRRS